MKTYSSTWHHQTIQSTQLLLTRGRGGGKYGVAILSRTTKTWANVKNKDRRPEIVWKPRYRVIYLRRLQISFSVTQITNQAPSSSQETYFEWTQNAVEIEFFWRPWSLRRPSSTAQDAGQVSKNEESLSKTRKWKRYRRTAEAEFQGVRLKLRFPQKTNTISGLTIIGFR
jgi:hypothetical protein